MLDDISAFSAKVAIKVSVKEMKKLAKPFELDYTQLKKDCLPRDLHFQTTAEVTPLEGVIEPDRPAGTLPIIYLALIQYS